MMQVSEWLTTIHEGGKACYIINLVFVGKPLKKFMGAKAHVE
ncbi:MAG: hypothetical protein ABFS39_05735 [Pseudomonadota bacterium]